MFSFSLFLTLISENRGKQQSPSEVLIGPSKVCALPLGVYLWHFLPEGAVQGSYKMSALIPTHKNNLPHTSKPTHLKPVWAGFILLFISW